MMAQSSEKCIRLTEAVIAKRQAARDQSKQGLSFGSKSRQLPADLETFCYSWLQIHDLASLFFVSHAVSSFVIRYLSNAKILVCLSKITPRTWRCLRFPLELAVKHCRKLTTVKFGGTNVVPGSEVERMLTALINNNRGALQRFPLLDDYRLASERSAVVRSWCC